MDTLDRESVRQANPIEQVIPELLGHPLRRRGREYAIPCPWHDDHDPSLRVNVDQQVWCCDPCGTGGDVFTFVERHIGGTFIEAIQFLADRAGLQTITPETAPGAIAATYDYRNAEGNLVFQVCRLGGPTKSFRQRRPDGRGGWIWNLTGVTPVLYRLLELLQADPSKPVFVCEGERDVDNLVALGLVATCNPGGAGKWRSEYNAVLADRHVVILADNDEAGRRHAEAIARSLQEVRR